MSQVNSYDRESYTTNGVAKSFSFGWNVNSTDDVKIAFVSADGVILNSATFIDSNDDEYTTSNYAFTVELNRQGGQVVFVDTPAEDQYLIIYRETPQVYENSFKTATAFPAVAIDKAYQKIWLAIQEISSDTIHNTLRLTPNQRGVTLGAFSENNNNAVLYFDSYNKKISYAGFTTYDIQNALVLVAQIPLIAQNASDALTLAGNAMTIANNAKSVAEQAREDASTAVQTANNAYNLASTALHAGDPVSLLSNDAGYVTQAELAQATATYIHDQATAASVWTIVHNLGKYPSVSVVDTGGNLVCGNVEYVDDDTCVVTFNAAFKGTAYLN